MIEFSTLFPVLVVNDLASLERFYTSLFGFEAVFFEPGFYLHLKHPANGSELGFLAPGHPSQPAFLHPLAGPEGMVLSFEVGDANRAFEQVSGADHEIVMPLRDEPWGQRHFMLRDPAGIVLDIVQHLPAE